MHFLLLPNQIHILHKADLSLNSSHTHDSLSPCWSKCLTEHSTCCKNDHGLPEVMRILHLVVQEHTLYPFNHTNKAIAFPPQISKFWSRQTAVICKLAIAEAAAGHIVGLPIGMTARSIDPDRMSCVTWSQSRTLLDEDDPAKLCSSDVKK